ncbi:MAG: hypothetical protein ACRC1I_17205 [Pseudomonas proteolytica]|uniref:hypothetical protein n=1 Tax=Pseudomonas proteolytica TaxID=219574 RepID=UPI003F313431
MDGQINVDDWSEFSADFHGWSSTNNLQSIKSLEPDENGYALIIETYSGGTDLRKTYNTDFQKGRPINVCFKIKLTPGTEISGMYLTALKSPPTSFTSLPIPPADSQWHEIDATFVPEVDELNRLWIFIKESKQERHRIYIDNIVVRF